MTEKDIPQIPLEELPKQSQTIGNLALQGTQEQIANNTLFGVGEKELLALVPDISVVTEGMKDYVRAVDGTSEDSPDFGGVKVKILTPRNPQNASNKARVSYNGVKIADRLIRQIILDGACYMNAHAAVEDGIERGRSILPETHEIDFLEGIYEGRIVPSAKILRRLRDASDVCIDNLEERLDGEEEEKVAGRYTLLKGIANENIPEESELSTPEKLDKMSLGVPLAALTFATRIPREVVVEAQSGAFDSYIAYDILQFADNNPKSRQTDIEKIGQLVPHIDDYNRTLGITMGKDEIYKVLASTVDSWPAAQRQIILEERNKMIDRFSGNLVKLFQTLDNAGFLSGDPANSGYEFGDSVKNYFEEIARRSQVTREAKAQIVAQRAQAGIGKKRPKTATKRQKNRQDKVLRAKNDRFRKFQELWGEEVEPEPIKLVTYDSGEEGFIDNVDSMVEKYMKTIGQQGNEVLRQDLNKILEYMSVPDRPVDQPDGIKHIKKPSRLQIGDGSYRLFELKPTEATGLPLRDDFAKRMRVYFCSTGPKTRCIINILRRADHDEFLDDLRKRSVL